MIWWLAMIIGWFAGILTVGIVVIAISIIIGKKEGC